MARLPSRRLAFHAWLLIGLGVAVGASDTVPAAPQSPGPDVRRLVEEADALHARRERVPLDQAVEKYREALEAPGISADRELKARAQLGLGRARLLLGYHDALDVTREAAQTFGSLGHLARQADALLAVGRMMQRRGQWSEGRRVTHEGLAIARRAGDRRVEGEAELAFAWAGVEETLVGDARLRALEELRLAATRAVDIHRQDGRQVELASALLGLAFQESGRQNQVHSRGTARALVEEALQVARAAAAVREQAFAHSLLGDYASSADPAQAVRFYQEAVSLTRKAGDQIQEGFVFNGLGRLYFQTGRMRAALSAFRESLAVRERIGDAAGIGVALNNIGVILQGLGEDAAGLAALRRAVEMHRSTGDRGEEAVTLVALASSAGSLADQRDILNQALAGARAAGRPDLESNVLVWLGTNAAASGSYREAVAWLEQAVAIDESRGASSSNGERHLGRILALLGSRDEALRHFDRAIAAADVANETRALATALAQSAVLRTESGDRVAAQAALDRALDLVRASDMQPTATARVYDSAGTVALIKGDIPRALQMFSLQLDIADRVRGVDRSTVLAKIGRAHLARRDRRRAADYLTRAMAESYSTSDKTDDALALTGLMEYWRWQNRPAAAAFFGKQAIDVFQQTRGSLLQMDIGVQRAYVESRASIYRDVADLLITLGQLVEAQEVLDLLKAEEFRDFVRRRDVAGLDPARPTERTLEEAAWVARYREIESRIMAIGRRRDELRRITDRTADEDRELTAVERDLAAANRAVLQAIEEMAAQFGPPAARRVQADLRGAQALMGKLRGLGDGTVAVYTLISRDKFHALVITPDARKAVSRTISPTDLNRLVGAVREDLQDPRIDPRPAGRALYDVVVGPIARDLVQARARTVMWILDGVLRYVPIGALHDGQRYVAEQFQNVVITLDRDALTQAPRPRWTGVGFGVSKPVGGFAGLPGVTDELQRIFRTPTAGRGLLDGHVLLDEGFTAETFRVSLRAGPPVVHIASHFQFRPGNEDDSFLLLGDGGRITLREFAEAVNIFEDVDLLTLSACDTAVGSAGATGAEIEGLAAQAQLLGAGAVVASLWPVADASTTAWMERFYRAKVAEGLDKASAVQVAQLALMTGAVRPTADTTLGASAPRGLSVGRTRKPFTAPADAPWAHPYYWAPFVLIGNWK
jgi:CHAT domain-containing protein